MRRNAARQNAAPTKEGHALRMNCIRKPKALLRLAGLLATASFLAALTLTVIVLAQVSTHFDLGWHLLSGGGGSRDSTHYRVDDSLGQWAGGSSASDNAELAPGFWVGTSAGPTRVPGDSHEVDDTCAVASVIAADGTPQTHDFHDQGDDDWVRFETQANKSYLITVDNVGPRVNAVLMLHNQCDQAPLASEGNAFGPTVQLEWNCTVAGWYYLRVLQSNPAIYGAGTNYDLSLALDAQPPSPPATLWAAPADRSLIVQWQRSPGSDVAGYRVRWGSNSGGPYGGSALVTGADNTYYQITGLTNGQATYVVIHALDLSGNESGPSNEVGDIPAPGQDTTVPAVLINLPTANPTYTTTLSTQTIGGACTDSGNNLSRVRVRNLTSSSEGWDYGLSGDSSSFSVSGIALNLGANNVQVTVFDAADRSSQTSLTIHRLGVSKGAAVVVGGRNNSGSLQANIDYSTNRAYRTFRNAGFDASDIFYLSPAPQDADNDGVNDVISPTTWANVHAAVQWAAGKVGPGVPFYLYAMDHGGIEAFCADGCSVNGRVSSQDLSSWLDELEASSGCDQVTVIVEACHSGSFIDREAASLSKNGRVVIASTSRDNLAYASAQGAYFSDAFFSAVAESNSLLASFSQAQGAVALTGVSQTPWLDDNGDEQFDASDGVLAGNRYIASAFGALAPEISLASVSEQAGTISAWVQPGNEPLHLVWAAVVPPSFQEPTFTTMELGVPLVRLEPDPQREGRYTGTYGTFAEQGLYRVVIYAEDRAGNQALPTLVRVGQRTVYLPILFAAGH